VNFSVKVVTQNSVSSSLYVVVVGGGFGRILYSTFASADQMKKSSNVQRTARRVIPANLKNLNLTDPVAPGKSAHVKSYVPVRLSMVSSVAGSSVSIKPEVCHVIRPNTFLRYPYEYLNVDPVHSIEFLKA